MQQRLNAIITLLDEKKAEAIELFDLQKSDYIASYVILATALNNRHTLALLDQLKNELKPKGEEFLGSDISDDWVAIDLGDILIHIMTPTYRERYDIESFLQELN